MSKANISNFLTQQESAQVRDAIATAERKTSGEIRVHFENHCNEEILDHAVFIFEELEMQQTAQRNGVLFYVAVIDNKFAIIGDEGINQKVPKDFWESTHQLVVEHFKAGEYAQGLVAGILKAGKILAAHFPPQLDNPNELSNEISYGK